MITLKSLQSHFLILGTIFCFLSCNPNQHGELNEMVRGSIDHKLNESKRVPLGGTITFFTKKPCTVSYEVSGKNPISRSFSEFNTRHNIPLIGLYPDTLNQIHITLTDKQGKQFKGSINARTEALPTFFPTIEITKIERSRMEPGLHHVELLIAKEGKFDSYSIIFDDDGVIRWYLDMSQTRRLCFSIPRMNSGHSMHVSWIDVFELDELGKTIQQWQLGGYAGDHDITELPDGNFLMGASKRESSILFNGQVLKTRADAVVELDRKTMNAVKEWDMRSILDVDRALLHEELGRDDFFDWFHVNSLAYSVNDDCLLISGRNQGIVKVDQTNQVKWILAPHKDWGQAGPKGEGPPTKVHLLTAIDEKGKAFSQEVQEGTLEIDEFEWPSGQHSVKILDNGNILIFDNGFARGFVKAPKYSRAVEYRIDEENKTIQQVWQFGKERGLDLFSAITSEVDVLPQTSNRLITSGYIRLSEDAPHAKMVEITYPDNEVVFEARMFFKNIAEKEVNTWAKFDVVYRGERMDMF